MEDEGGRGKGRLGVLPCGARLVCGVLLAYRRLQIVVREVVRVDCGRHPRRRCRWVGYIPFQTHTVEHLGYWGEEHEVEGIRWIGSDLCACAVLLR